jgi:hypothetical protein
MIWDAALFSEGPDGLAAGLLLGDQLAPILTFSSFTFQNPTPASAGRWFADAYHQCQGVRPALL